MKPNLLTLVPYEHSILRKRTQDIKFPLSTADQQTIADMLYSIQPEQLLKAKAPWEGAVGMAANQWGIDKSIFLFCPEGNHQPDIEVIINPSYTPIVNILMTAASEDDEWEGCFSVPLATGYIHRHLKIKVKYQNIAGEIIEKELSGWPARVWQHENDHLNGLLYDDHVAGKCLEKHKFETIAKLDEFYDTIREARNKGK